jgi:hypothetical protein
MPTHLYRLIVPCLLLSLAFVLLPSGSALAQELSPLASKPASGGPELADPVETASVRDLPSAPTPTVASAGALMIPANSASMPPMALAPVLVQPNVPAQHRFWDRENRILFATVGAFAAADFCVTRANLASGGRELNPVTRVLSGSTPGLAANFALETGGVMAISYAFHRTGHHKLERITSLVNIGTSAAAVGYDLAHR